MEWDFSTGTELIATRCLTHKFENPRFILAVLSLPLSLRPDVLPSDLMSLCYALDGSRNWILWSVWSGQLPVDCSKAAEMQFTLAYTGWMRTRRLNRSLV